MEIRVRRYLLVRYFKLVVLWGLRGGCLLLNFRRLGPQHFKAAIGIRRSSGHSAGVVLHRNVACLVYCDDPAVTTVERLGENRFDGLVDGLSGVLYSGGDIVRDRVPNVLLSLASTRNGASFIVGKRSSSDDWTITDSPKLFA